jgi:hypothetical protein
MCGLMMLEMLREGYDIAQMCVYIVYVRRWAMPRLYSRVALRLPSLQGMMDNYDRCLLGLRMYRSKEHVENFDAMVKSYVEIHKTHII